MTEDSVSQNLAKRVLTAIDRRVSTTNPRVERLLLVVAAIAFMAGAVWAWREVGDQVELDWRFIVANALLGVPATIALNATEFRLGAALVGTRPTMRDALTVSVVGSAANLLPLPGAALVRIRALRQDGSSYGGATRVTAAIGATFVGVAALVAAASAWTFDARAVAWVLLATGTIALIAAAVLLAGRARPAPSWLVQLFAVEFAALGLIAIRFAASLRAIGVGPTIATVTLMAASGPLATASGVLPGGIGLREGLAAFLATQAGTAAASGFLAVALDRVVELAVTGTIAVGLTYLGSRAERPTAE